MAHKLFAESLNKARIQADPTTRASREAAVDDVAQSADAVLALSLIKFYLRTEDFEELDGIVRSAFKKKDKSLPPREHEQEIRILAGEAVAHMFEVGSPDAASIAALALSCFPKKSGEPVGHLRDEALSFQLQMGEKNRILEFVSPGCGLSVPKVKKLASTTDASAFAKEAAELGQQLLTFQQQNESLFRNQQVLSEEASIAWWLITRKSLSPDQVSKSDFTSSRLVEAAWDLAHLTRLLPPLPRYQLFLSAYLEPTTQIDTKLVASEIWVSVDQSLSGKLDQLCSSNPAKALCPIINQRGPIKGAQTKVNALELAAQTYLEILLLRAAAGDGLGI